MDATTSFPRGRGPRRDEGQSGNRTEKRSLSLTSRSRQKDFLFGKEETSMPRKKRKTTNAATAAATPTSSSNKTSLMPLGGGGVVTPSKKGLSWIEGLSFTKLAKGVKLLACVREVHADLVIFSLPNMWTGFMMPSSGENGVSCSDMLVAGQFVSVAIVKAVQEQTKGGVPRRRIQVSCLPAAVNPTGAVALKGNALTVPGMIIRCQVKSIEDHGILMDLGFGRLGFLPFDEIQQEYELGDEDNDHIDKDEEESSVKLKLVQGRILDCLVRSATLHSRETAIVPLALPTSIAKQFVPATFTPKLTELQPGMLVHAKIESLVRNGLCVSFCGNVFRGAVELQHSGGFWIPEQRHESEEWKAVFDRNRSVVARIIAVDAATKMVRLSLQQHVLELRLPPSLPPVGEVRDAVVIRLDPGIGALLALSSDDMEQDDDGDDDEDGGKDRDKNRLFKPISTDKSFRKASRVRAAYVHISKAMDKDKNEKKTSDAAFAKEFAPSTKHKVRIVSTSNMIDGIASGAAAPSIVNAHVLTHADLHGGKVYKQVPVCAQLDGGGVLVDLGTGVRGLIPQIHLFDKSVSNDYRNKMRRVKYSVGAKVDVRVLSVDAHTKRCILTAKKSLVKAEDFINSFHNVRVGDIATGFISKVDDHGLSVTFFNGVYGRVTAYSLAAELGIDDHKQDYGVGDVLQCRVTNIRKRANPRKSSRFYNDSGDEMDEDDADGSPKPSYRQLTLSLKLDGELMQEDGSAEGMPPKKFQLRPGALLPAKSMLIVSLIKGKEKDNGFVPGYAIIRIKSKHLTDENNSTEAVPFLECKLPFDQLLDHYNDSDIESASSMDAVAEKMLTVGKKINRRGFVLSDPKKSKAEYCSGIGSMPIVSIRANLVEALSKELWDSENSELEPILPNPRSSLFKGALFQGYVAQVDKRHGAFVRYLNGLTGLVPRKKGGLLLPLYRTIVTEVLAVDVRTDPPKLLVKAKLKMTGSNEKSATESPVKVGDVINEATISKIDFHRTALDINDDLPSKSKIKARVHCTMAHSTPLKITPGKPHKSSAKTISKYHPFKQWEVGQKLTKLTVASVEKKGGTYFVELTNRKSDNGINSRIFYDSAAQLSVGDKVSGIVTSVVEGKGLWLEASPGLSCHVPALEVSSNVDILNNMGEYFPRGSRLECTVMDKAGCDLTRSQYIPCANRKNGHTKRDVPFLSLLGPAATSSGARPARGDLLVGQINRSLPVLAAPALMLDLRGGYIGRCCITELEEPDNWTNMPLGRETMIHHEDQKTGECFENQDDSDSSVVSDDSEEDGVAEERVSKAPIPEEEFAHRRFVQCRVLVDVQSRPVVGVSLRTSRIEGDLDDDDEPEPGSQVQAYVVATTKKGCFVRVSQKIEGRVLLKELCDGFLPNPDTAFPAGRLVVGKVKAIQNSSKKRNVNKKIVDLDMRESVLLESEEKLKLDDIEVGKKYKGSVTRVEDYGVFVRVDKSDVSGLVHKSECSDSYIKNLSILYDPGDLVKVLVLKKDVEKKQLGFSMKASHFENDSDSEDDSSIGDDDSMAELVEDSEAESDAENRVAAPTGRMQNAKEEEIEAVSSGADSESTDSGSESESESGESDNDVDHDVSRSREFRQSMDTDVGFDWGEGRPERDDKDSSESEGDEETSGSEDEDGVHKSSHKSRRKHSQRRKEEQEITRREIALADGTADDNPETAADFERLLASNPNSSEVWIKYMAFHLSLADVSAARDVAARAFERIEFREEREKLNVWCALLTLELKYGTESSLQEAIGQACQQNNPKHVYLRVCEMLEKDPSAAGGWEKVDGMYEKMCKKFKSKKKTWIAHMEYLLRSGRQEDAYSLSKRAMQSLPAYKHVETMSKLAQLVFEYGSPERARTLFDGLLLKYPKRLDIFFVYADKEVKHGEVSTARALFERVANRADETLTLKLSDKQMKSFFKKWYVFEEQHGTEDSQEHVKDAARRYVEQTTPSS